MQQRNPTGLGPTLAQLGNDGFERRHNLLVIRLVREMADALAHLPCLVDGVIANGAAEQHNRTAVRLQAPLVHSTDGQDLVGEAQP